MAVPKPVIAVVNGPAVGAGFVLACCCDMRIASADAVVLTAFSRLGLIAEHGIAWLLPRLIGSAAAMDLMLSSRKVTAAEGLALGLFNRVVAPDRLMAEAREYAKTLVDTISPRSLRVIKRQMWDAQFQDFGEALSSATDELHQSFESSDFRSRIDETEAEFAGS
jgi:enoyl-CoA hydratase/carnithine racemase